jgi:TrmH family RNA methyltransferase
MGSIFRIPVHSVDPVPFLQQHADIPTYAAVLQGTDVHSIQTSEKGILIIGNESKGIQDDLVTLSSHRISIPSRGKAESLNAAVATGILCDVILSKS